jgi:crotonobetainyl-CoA:carnitine CoA-transferase CaiB-like acyl-CoA transferase
VADQDALLEGITVVDFSQFLSGPSASLRLADLGATVIKVERPGSGDICRDLYVSDVSIDGDSTIFHAINRNKLGYVADLKDPVDHERIKWLLAQADVVMHNFRPGVIDRLGLGYEVVRGLNRGVVYGEISGYGKVGPWAAKPGQDLLLQAISGMTGLSGDADDGPVAMGVAVVDIWAGALLVEGILAALVGRGVTGEGALVEVNMLEAAMDYQFEPVTVYLTDGSLPQRTRSNGAHSLIGAPYGVYATADGYLALAMGRVPQLGELLDLPALMRYKAPASWFAERDEIKAILAEHLATRATQAWLDILEAADIWCAEVLDWETLLAHEQFGQLEVLQTVERGNGTHYETTVCPIRVDGRKLTSSLGSCALGEHNELIDRRFGLR